MKKIIFAGEGGQGVQVAAEILAKAAFDEGFFSTYIPNFGVEQRGGVSIAFVIVDKDKIAYPKFRDADWAVIFSPRSRERIKIYLSERTKIILGPAIIGGMKTKLPSGSWNILLLGKVNHLGKIVDIKFLLSEMSKRFSRQFQANPSLKQIDTLALSEGGR